MIQMLVQPRTKSPRTRRGILWLATGMWNNEPFKAESRNSAATALARVLVKAGAPDQPVEVTTIVISGRERRQLPGHMRYPSLHKMAGQTIEERERVPVRVARHREIDASGSTFRPKQGETTSDG